MTKTRAAPAVPQTHTRVRWAVPQGLQVPKHTWLFGQLAARWALRKEACTRERQQEPGAALCLWKGLLPAWEEAPGPVLPVPMHTLVPFVPLALQAAPAFRRHHSGYLITQPLLLQPSTSV